MVPGDLTSLASLKAYLSGMTQTTDDVVLASLISVASEVARNYCSMLFLPQLFTEKRNGTDSRKIAVLNSPIISVTSVSINGIVVPKSTDGVNVSGWTNDESFIAIVGCPAAGVTSGWQSLDKFWRGFQNITLVYRGGFQVTDEPATIPATPFQVVPQRAWTVDAGVKYSNGTPLVAITSGTPTIGQYLAGQLSNGKLGYTFAAADAAANVLLSYGYCPADLEMAIWEIASVRYKDRGRIGEKNKSLAGETVAFEKNMIPPAAKSVLDNYGRNVMAV